MDRIDLDEEFVKTLHKKIPKRANLVDKISDILRIEKESASRRLSRKVQFSIREMGLLAKEMNISVDSLMNKDSDYYWIPVQFQSPMMLKSMDVLYDTIDRSFDKVKKMIQEGFTEYGTVFNSLPVEFFMYYPSLMKFMFFKWGYYFVGTEEFDKFSQWHLSSRLSNIKERYEYLFSNFDSTFYIWDNPLIVTLVKEIHNFYKMNIISTEDKDAIKNDLKDLLTNVELYMKGTLHFSVPVSDFAFYASTVDIGITSCYYLSETRSQTVFKSNFICSDADESYDTGTRMKEWINSLRNISILLSRSGHVERRLFFARQHEIVDSILQ